MNNKKFFYNNAVYTVNDIQSDDLYSIHSPPFSKTTPNVINDSSQEFRSMEGLDFFINSLQKTINQVNKIKKLDEGTRTIMEALDDDQRDDKFFVVNQSINRGDDLKSSSAFYRWHWWRTCHKAFNKQYRIICKRRRQENLGNASTQAKYEYLSHVHNLITSWWKTNNNSMDAGKMKIGIWVLIQGIEKLNDRYTKKFKQTAKYRFFQTSKTETQRVVDHIKNYFEKNSYHIDNLNVGDNHQRISISY